MTSSALSKPLAPTTNASLEQLVADTAAQLREGDILFISINAFLYRQVARGTGSWCSHVGIAIKEAGEWWVLESKVPTVARTRLRDFLARTCNGELAVRRLPRPLSADERVKLKAAAEQRMGIWYHLGFRYDSKRMFCSKFVYEVYREALGFLPGKLQTLGELLDENPQASVGFWRTWYLGFIPWSRRTVTPASQLHDPRLVTVLDTTAG
ncbi:YiiX/YebB-like N1pC/P60 family cysteine hydrolase [Motiliproteus sediminis]|uniref:YiiX/YebB-like N1pC/P60 family cysteine hydrolase n=1 Tax=Motiliproteus sediminis TaxID=1468178 RepID=UPI001AEF54FC|nr:YiiX/YebB-like N1pC/P60 family cysteine hydrolase [Motiliproteus sediminis]